MAALEVISYQGDVVAEVVDFERADDPHPFICRLGGGLLNFVEYVFPEAESRNIYAQLNVREPEGRGAHFDVYAPYLDRHYPYVAVYNLAGKVSVRTTVLPSVFADNYFANFPEPTDLAYDARRRFADLALMTPGAVIYEGELEPRTGLILPQKREGAHHVHDVVPVSPVQPGYFVKLAVSSGGQESLELLRQGEYEQFDDFVTKAVDAFAKPDQQGGIEALLPSAQRSTVQPRRHCNLD